MKREAKLKMIQLLLLKVYPFTLRDSIYACPLDMFKICLFSVPIRAEEKCLVRSGLVHLLDRLCSLANHRADMNMETQSTRQKVSAMAWAGFQVLADRCVMWETEEGKQ